LQLEVTQVKLVFGKNGEMLLETRSDLLIPADSYYELPTGVRFKMVGGTGAPVFVCMDYFDPETEFRLVNSSVMFMPKAHFTELVLQLWNPSHTSQAVPAGTVIASLYDGVDSGIIFQEVDA
jgi:hypothetical protein